MKHLPDKTRGPMQSGQRQHANAGVRGSSRTAVPGQETVTAQGSPRPRESLRLLRFPAVRERTGLSRSTIWRLERQGAFPQHRRISANVVAWVEQEITVWIQAKIGDIAV